MTSIAAACSGAPNNATSADDMAIPGWEVVAARLAAAMLVGASAGLGGLYAWQTGANNGLALAGLAVTAALALELSKPLAISGALAAGWRRPVRALALGALGVAAMSYSLLAQLSLLAGARADAVSARSNGNDKASAAARERDRLLFELSAMPSGRGRAEIEAQISVLLHKHRGALESGCHDWQPTISDRAACVEIGRLRAEQARADARERATAALQKAQQAVADVGAPKVADPGASALAGLLAALGIVANADGLGVWLALVPVLALEAGSCLAGVLAGLGGPARPPCPEPGGSPDTRLRTGGMRLEAVDPLSSVEIAVDERLISFIRESGGRWNGTQRELATAVGSSKSAINETLGRLSASGAIELRTSPAGSDIRLVGQRIH